MSRHNEDGSYTYGYEAADGTFKLETRFPDGGVQGKYGYVDVNGEVKIIEYGANAMGFQPTGDLPEGIIIPPPVEGNCTDCNYDYDYEERPETTLLEEDRSRTTIINRARGGQPPRGAQQPPNQNRGQTLDQPITPRPLPRRPEPAFRPAQQQQQFSAFPSAPAQQQQQQQQFSAFPSTPVQQQTQQQFPGFPTAAPAQPFIPTRAPARQASRQPTPRPAANRPSAARPAVSRPVPSRQATPQPSSFRPTPPAPAAPRPAPVQSSSSGGDSGSFANFPARDNPNRGRGRPGSSTPSRSQSPARTPVAAAPSAPLRAAPARSASPSRGSSASQASSRQPAFNPAPIRPAFEDPAVASAPRFSSFQAQPLPPRPAQALQPRPATPQCQASRPALTFADARPAVPAAPVNLPPSALDSLVDFNQLVQEFQGSRNGGRQLQQQQPTARFSTDNFPIRY